jgi:hypothetical protein
MQFSVKATAYITGGALVLGVGLGLATQPTPETRVVKVPEYRTRVVEKEVPVPSSETVTVSTPLPESCLHAIELLPAVVAQSDVQANATGRIMLALSDLGSGTAIHDIHKINDAIESIRKQRDRLGDSVIGAHTALTTFQSVLETCNSDLGE